LESNNITNLKEGCDDSPELRHDWKLSFCYYLTNTFLLQDKLLKKTVFWDMALYSLVEIDRRFKGA
jgi:hypothetical protein